MATNGWGLKVRVWVERGGRKVLGPGRAELLEHIGREHSISAAARLMGMSYRRAWGLVHDMNEAAGVPLVESSTGGPHGGGAALTPHGQQAVRLYRALAARFARSAEEAALPASPLADPPGTR
jgi:molybdate transport system regulatory protein